MIDSGFGSFFQQIPSGIIVIFAASVVGLILAIVLMVADRRRRASRRPAAASASTSPISGMPAVTMSSSSFGGDLPDLDALVTRAPAVRGIGGTARLRLNSGEEVDAAEVMTIYRDVAEGGLVFQIGDRIHRNPPIDADSDFRRRLASTLREMQTGAAPAAVPSASGPISTPPMAAAPVSSTREMPPAGVTMPGDLPRFKLPDTLEVQKRGRRRPPSEPIPEINIAQAIETYLQYKLMTGDDFPGRSIHVRTAQNGGLLIEVDGQLYEEISDVADPEVREYLQTAITEWQGRQ
jgi:hypothetical protein